MTATDQQASRWLAEDSSEPEVQVIGVASAHGSRGVALAPMEVRDRLGRFATYHGVTGVNISSVARRDVGNWPVSSIEPAPLVEDLIKRARALPVGFKIYLGGDNAITRPLVTAEADELTKVGLICFDAEHGVDPLFGGPTNKNAIRGLMDDGMPGSNVVQIGIHPLGNYRSARAYCDEAGITTVTVEQVAKIGIVAAVDVAVSQLSARCESIYLNVDLGVLDSAFAPAVESARPGGLGVAELAQGVARCAEHHKVSAMDLVEVDPTIDHDSRTLDVMAYLLLNAVAGLAGRS